MLQDKDSEYKLTASFVEIYNEYIKDLLKPKTKEYLELWDDPVQGTIISGVTELEVSNIGGIMKLLHLGNGRRTTESTRANEASSRSHAIFQLCIQRRPRLAGYEFELKKGMVSLIDLAGSERGSATENRGARLFEGAKINRSLLALANCINALGDKARKGTFVPYRDSKLTRILKESLGGKSKTLMLCNASPASNQFEETLNTLKYANRAKEIKVQAEESKKVVELHVAEYKHIIEELRGEISSLQKLGTANKAVSDSVECPRCRIDEETEERVERLKELFDEQMQLRKQVCEIKAQNKLNQMEIVEGHELLKTMGEMGRMKLDEIAELQSSMELNATLK